MDIFVLGLNHKTAPVEIRERMSVPAAKAGEVMDAFARNQIFRERLILSTCNRTEIYGVARKGERDIEKAKSFLSEYSRLSLRDLEDKLYVLAQPRSVEHLFAVASGLDSMVVGETEIIGQVKNAYLLAHQHGQTGKVLNTLFQRSLKVAKHLRTHTEIGTGRVSVGSVAVDLAGKIFEDLKKTRVYVIGTGEMAKQVAKALASRGSQPVIISSHHFDRAEELAAELGGSCLRFDEYESKIKEADILIASTACTGPYLVKADQVQHWMKARHQQPLFFIDIAMPRNIDPAVDRIDNVYLYNLDDLQGIAEKNRAMRENEITHCRGLVEAQTTRFMDWMTKEFTNKVPHAEETA